jgi:hypothetical protein
VADGPRRRLADGRECKTVTGIDDHSRYIVIAAVVVIPTGMAVVKAFVAAMRRYGVPSEVLTDNGKQFTGRFTRPYPAEVLFERICRENGISQRLTKRRSPTTTGKVEWFHKTLREELLDDVEAFESLDAAQDAISAWVHEYNHSRPHQSLDMATPASLFRPSKPKPLTVPSMALESANATTDTEFDVVAALIQGPLASRAVRRAAVHRTHAHDRREHRASVHRAVPPPCGRGSNTGINGSASVHSSCGTNRNDKRTTIAKIIARQRQITT